MLNEVTNVSLVSLCIPYFVRAEIMVCAFVPLKSIKWKHVFAENHENHLKTHTPLNQISILIFSIFFITVLMFQRIHCQIMSANYYNWKYGNSFFSGSFGLTSGKILHHKSSYKNFRRLTSWISFFDCAHKFHLTFIEFSIHSVDWHGQIYLKFADYYWTFAIVRKCRLGRTLYTLWLVTQNKYMYIE